MKIAFHPEYFIDFFVLILVIFLPGLVLFVLGTESERSCAFSSGRDSQRKLLRQSVAGSSSGKPMKIAAINGKPRVNNQYLGMSRECEFSFINSFTFSLDFYLLAFNL